MRRPPSRFFRCSFLPPGEGRTALLGFNGHVRRRLRRAAAGLDRLRPLRRSHRTQSDPGRLAADDGAGDFRDRFSAHVPSHRHFGTGPADHPSLLPGSRARRRMVRRRPLGDRNGRTGQTRRAAMWPQLGAPFGFILANGFFLLLAVGFQFRLDAADARRPFPGLGMADSLSALDRDGPAGAVRPRQTARDARLRQRR